MQQCLYPSHSLQYVTDILESLEGKLHDKYSSEDTMEAIRTFLKFSGVQPKEGIESFLIYKNSFIAWIVEVSNNCSFVYQYPVGVLQQLLMQLGQ